MSDFNSILLTACCLFFFAINCHGRNHFREKQLNLIPFPKVVIKSENADYFTFDQNTLFIVENAQQQTITDLLLSKFKKVSSWELKTIVGTKPQNNSILLRTEKDFDEEGYQLEIYKDQILIEASESPGFFYALQTLRQLLPAEIENANKTGNVRWKVPCLKIKDSPSFKWRGYMLDVSRHFFPKEFILDLIDYLALHKINTLHLHLVDDQGWRIEIKKYPKLTDIGAWRVNQEKIRWNSRKINKLGEPTTYGGFYAQDDIREIVSFASKRYINIVPEIEMPSHCTSALASYPQFSCTGEPRMVYSGAIHNSTNIYCAGNDSTFLFLNEVLSEIFQLFPFKYIHLGGDEARKKEWVTCKKCQQRIQEENLTGTDDLQGYFMRRVERFIHSQGRVMIGWDEVLEDHLPARSTIMCWRESKNVTDAVKQGHSIILSPMTPYYFSASTGFWDWCQLRFKSRNHLKKVYLFDPIPEELSNTQTKYILGGQANLWTEHVPDKNSVLKKTFPRIAALAEIFWTFPPKKDWKNFRTRAKQFYKRYQYMFNN